MSPTPSGQPKIGHLRGPTWGLQRFKGKLRLAVLPKGTKVLEVVVSRNGARTLRARTINEHLLIRIREGYFEEAPAELRGKRGRKWK